MLARKFNSLGRMRCPRPCRARKATLRPSSVPSTKASEGAPNGVFNFTSFTLLSPGIEYSPLPPMIPISACGKRPPTFSRPSELSKRESQTRDYTGAHLRQTAAYSLTNYNSPMKLAPILFLGFSLFSHAVIAQEASKAAAPSQPEPQSVTVPITLDHNRVVIDVYLPLAHGAHTRA